MKQIFKRSVLALLIPLGLHSQSNYKGWFNHNRMIDFSTTPALKPIHNSNGTPDRPTNSMFDSEGKLLFYISDATYQIYNKFNSSIGTLGVPSGYSLGSMTEISIIPNPSNNSCVNKYYVVYRVFNNGGLGGYLSYGEVDMNTNNGQGSYTQFASTIGTFMGVPHNPMAVSKVHSNGKRYLYAEGNSSSLIQVLEVGSTGLTPLGSLGITSPAIVLSHELELTNAGNNLAFSNGSNIYIVPLSTSTGMYTGGTVISFAAQAGTHVHGLEFNNAGDKLFFSVPGQGVYVRDIPGASTSVVGISTSYGIGMLEKSYNGSEIICSDGTNIVGINAVTNTISGWSINYHLPTLSLSHANFVLMPDQIDGENYAATNGINIDVVNYNQSTNATWIPTSNPILTSLQNIYAGNLTSLPIIRWGGDLTISNNAVVTISGMEFQHNTNTEIKINGGSNVTITGSFLHAHTCGKMWKGIDVNNNNSGSTTTLLMQKAPLKGANTRVADAIKGVYAHHSNSLLRIITKCVFYDNERGVVVVNGNPNNEFYNCNYQQINPLRDQAYGSSNGYGSNKYGITGIEIQNTPLNTQNIGWAATVGNYFDGGQYGVDALGSSLNSYLNTFNAIKGTGLRSNANFVSGVSVNVQSSVFTSNWYDVDCFFGNNLTVQKSQFSNCGGHSVSWNYNNHKKLVVGADLTFGASVGTSADANTFSGCGWTAVRCLDNAAQFVNELNLGTIIQVNYNTIQNAPYSDGISVMETSLIPPTLTTTRTYQQFYISRNTITNIANAVLLDNLRGDILSAQGVAHYNNINPSSEPPIATVELNNINFNATAYLNTAGIKAYHCPQVKIFENSVISDNNGNWQNIGIDVSDSPMSFTWKNSVIAGRGVVSRTDMLNANIMCNDFTDCVIGIQLNWEWLRNNTDVHGIPGIYNRRNDFLNSTSGFDMECYHSQPTLNRWSNPNAFAVAYTGVTGSIINDNTIYNPVCYACHSCRTMSNTDTTVNQYSSSEKMNSASDQGKYNQYRAWYENYSRVNENKTAAIAGLPAAAQQRLAGIVTAAENLSARNFTAAASVLQSISTGNDYENNLTTVYQILADKKLNGYRLATPTESTTLYGIAEQHPIEAGPAVYSARAILKADFNINFNMNDSTGVPLNSNSRTMNRPASATNDLLVFPNPSNGQIQILAQQKVNFAYELFDVLGVSVEKGNIMSNIPLNISHLKGGSYILVLTNSVTGETTQKSLILSK